MNGGYYSQYNKEHSSYDYSNILERTSITNEISSILNSFEERKTDVQFKKGIYI